MGIIMGIRWTGVMVARLADTRLPNEQDLPQGFSLRHAPPLPTLLPRLLLVGFALMARRAAFASGNTRLVTRPFVGGALLVGSASTPAGDLTLLVAVHRSESAPASLASLRHSALCHLDRPPIRIHPDLFHVTVSSSVL
jgi:hypothetical protein